MVSLMPKNTQEYPEINSRLFPSRFDNLYYILTNMREELKFATKHYLEGKEGLTLVDYGCGNKPYRSIFEQYIQQYIGVDLAGNLDADIALSTEGKIALPNDSADVVLSTQVLEHVEDPDKYLRECYRILKNDGLLILSTHGYWIYHPIPTDYWRWTSSGLQKIVEKTGFKVDRVIGVMGVLPTAVQIIQDIIITKIWLLARPFFAFLMQTIISLLDKLHTEKSKRRDACVFFILAKKTSQP
jgi:SAM-dependent methyltransferase